MAKIARVGYGSLGQGVGNNPDGYTYVVNNSVNVGDRIQVIATSSKGRKFGTTAVPLSTHGENTVKGKQAKIDALSSGDRSVSGFLKGTINQADLDRIASQSVTRAYSGRNLGISRKGLTQEQYRQEVRGGSLKQYVNKVGEVPMSDKAKENFDSYSAKYMNKGEQE